MFEQHFALRENPFAAGHQSKFVYPSPEHQEALAHLRYGIENREPFVLITGEVGTGKTTALYEVLGELKSRAIVAVITNSALSRIELLEEIGIRLGLAVPPGSSKPQLLAHLERHLLALRSKGERALLLLDEGQNLDRELLEEIRLLSNLEAQGEKLLQVFLLGQPELDHKLGRPELRQLRQRINVQYRLKPLGEADCGRYIHHRIAVAGGHGPSIFPEEACREVFALSHGIPREINQLCAQAMLDAFVEDAPAVTPAHVRVAASEIEFESVMGAGATPDRADVPQSIVIEAPPELPDWTRPPEERGTPAPPAAPAASAPPARPAAPTPPPSPPVVPLDTEQEYEELPIDQATEHHPTTPVIPATDEASWDSWVKSLMATREPAGETHAAPEAMPSGEEALPLSEPVAEMPLEPEPVHETPAAAGPPVNAIGDVATPDWVTAMAGEGDVEEPDVPAPARWTEPFSAEPAEPLPAAQADWIEPTAATAHPTPGEPEPLLEQASFESEVAEPPDASLALPDFQLETMKPPPPAMESVFAMPKLPTSHPAPTEPEPIEQPAARDEEPPAPASPLRAPVAREFEVEHTLVPIPAKERPGAEDAWRPPLWTPRSAARGRPVPARSSRSTWPLKEEETRGASTAMRWLVGIGIVALIAVAAVLVFRFLPGGQPQTVGEQATGPATTAPRQPETTAPPPSATSSASAQESEPAPSPAAPPQEAPAPAETPESVPSAPEPVAAAPEPSPEPPVVAKPRPARQIVYSLVVASYLNQDRAEEERQRIAAGTGFPLSTRTTMEGGAPVYELVLGQFPTRAAAEKAAGDLVAQGLVNQARVFAQAAPAGAQKTTLTR